MRNKVLVFILFSLFSNLLLSQNIITNADCIKLAKGGFSDEIILNKINSSSRVTFILICPC